MSYLFIYLFIYSFIYLFIYLFVYNFLSGIPRSARAGLNETIITSLKLSLMSIFRNLFILNNFFFSNLIEKLPFTLVDMV